MIDIETAMQIRTIAAESLAPDVQATQEQRREAREIYTRMTDIIERSMGQKALVSLEDAGF